MSDTTAKNFFGTEKELKEVLDYAEENASGNWEEKFVTNLQDRWEKFGFEMRLTQPTYDRLIQIGA